MSSTHMLVNNRARERSETANKTNKRWHSHAREQRKSINKISRKQIGQARVALTFWGAEKNV